MNTITTANMIEVAYLLERRHTITSINTEHRGPYGIRELAVTMSGEQIELDHYSFIRVGSINEQKLPQALALVIEQLHIKAEGVVR
jgi:hypothetical protein